MDKEVKVDSIIGKMNINVLGLDSIMTLEDKENNTLTIEYNTKKIEKTYKLKLRDQAYAQTNALHEYAKCLFKTLKNDKQQETAKIKLVLSAGIVVLAQAASYTICKEISTQLGMISILASMGFSASVSSLGCLLKEREEIDHDRDYYSLDVDVEVNEHRR